MRVILLSAFFPPDAQGGAEISAWNLGRWLRAHGHEVGVLTTARRAEDAVADRMEDGLRVWRVRMPRPYPVHDYGTPGGAMRAVWHLQDHFDPRNRSIAANVLDIFRPDFVTVHLLTGIGWNILPDLARRDLPVMFALPDLALACLRSGMFRGGRNCSVQCADCRLSALWKARMRAPLRRIGYYSPSAANLARLERYVSLGNHPRRLLANPNRYPPASVVHVRSPVTRLLYAGRLHATKGVHILLDAAERLALAGRVFSLDIAGAGPEGAALRARFGHYPWVRFHGHVTQTALSNLMMKSDLLCIPSIWSENAPGVAIHALTLGLPVAASATGGLPELIEAGRNGLLVPQGDAESWAAALAPLFNAPGLLAAMRDEAAAAAHRFDPEVAGAALFRFMSEIASRGSTRSTSSQDGTM